MFIIYKVFLVTYLAICPVCDYKNESSYECNFKTEPTKQSSNIMECQKCHVALFGHAEKWEYLRDENPQMMQT